MKVGLINTYSYGNVGDAAIYAGLRKLLKEHQVWATIQQQEYEACTDIEHRQSLDGCDMYVSVGGDIFNNSRPWFITKNFLRNILELRKAPQKTILFGQSIPASCRGLSMKLLSQQLKRLPSVTVRDQQSHQLLSRQGVNCRLSYDTAFVLHCSKGAIEQAREILKTLKAPRSAVISLRGFNLLYPADNSQFVHHIAKLCQQLEINGYQPVLLIQSNVSDLDSDWGIAKAVLLQYPSAKVLDIFSYSQSFNSWEILQAVLKIASLIVAVRYHTAVLALAAGRTPFNLYYSNKGADLTNRLGIPGCHIDQFNPGSREIIELIETTASLPFDAENIRMDVMQAFSEGLHLGRANMQKIRQQNAIA